MENIDEADITGLPIAREFVVPTINALISGHERTADIRAFVANVFTTEGRVALTTLSGAERKTFNNRVAWSLVWMQPSLVKKVATGLYALTENGQQLKAIGLVRDIGDIASFLNLKHQGTREPSTSSLATSGGHTNTDVLPAEPPDEQIERLAHHLDHELQDSLIDRVKTLHPQAFEVIVVRLLSAMGYGGGAAELAHTTRYVGDDGIDGIINEDALGLDSVYIQAKRFTERTVGGPEVKAFVGSLNGVNASKGVFVTTSEFSASAKEYVQRVPQRIVLIDGQRLAQLMIRYNVGVRSKQIINIKEIDENDFDECS